MRSHNLLALLAAIPLLLYIVYPMVSMLIESLTFPVSNWRAERMGWAEDRQPAFAGLRAILSEPFAWRAIWGTLRLSLLTVLFGCLWGTGLALLWQRRDFPGRWLFALLGYAPLLMPPLVGTIAFVRLLGDGGLLWSLFPSSWQVQRWLSPPERVLLLHIYAFGIYAYAFVASALRRLDASQHEAVRSLGGGYWPVFRHALWPAIAAPLAAAALFIFMAAGASFSAPYLLDNRGAYLTVEILNLSRVANELAIGLTIVLLLLSLLALPPFLYLQKKIGFDTTLGTKGNARQLTPVRNRMVYVYWCLSLPCALILITPPLMVVAGFWIDTRRSADGSSLWQYLSTMPQEAWGSLGNSMHYGLLAALGCVIAALFSGLALRRATNWAQLPTECALALALALPGSAVAIALLSAFNGPSILTGGQALGQQSALLILAYFIRNLPLAYRPIRAALSHIGAQYEEAAANLGASPIRTLIKVTLPLLWPALCAALLLCFVSGAGEFVASEMLFGPDCVPASVRINMYYAFGELGLASTLALLLMLICALAAIFGSKLQNASRGH